MNKAEWRPADPRAVGELMARWFEGDLATRPGPDPGPAPNMPDYIRDALAAMCRAGLIVLRWESGTLDGDYVSRSAVEAVVVSPEAAEAVAAAARDEEYYTNPKGGKLVVESDDELVFFGQPATEEERRSTWHGIPPGVADQMATLPTLTVIEPTWGDGSPSLWETIQDGLANL